MNEILHDQEKFKMVYLTYNEGERVSHDELEEWKNNTNFILDLVLRREYIPKGLSVEPEIFQKVYKINEVIGELESDFSHQIENVENLNVDYYKCLHDVSKMLSRPVNGMQKISQDFKKDFIQLVEVREELNEKIDQMMDSYYLVRNKHQETIFEIESLVKSLIGFTETNPGFSKEIHEMISSVAQIECGENETAKMDDIPSLIEQSQNLEEELTHQVNLLLGEATERQKIIERVKVLVSENAEIKQYDV